MMLDATELEVWNTIKALNDAWTRGRVEDLRQYFHEDMVAINPVIRERITGGEACFNSWAAFAAATTIHEWRESDPLVRVFGDTAVVTYYWDIVYDMDGNRVETGGRDMFAMVREDGRWLAVANQFSAYPGQSA